MTLQKLLSVIGADPPKKQSAFINISRSILYSDACLNANFLDDVKKMFAKYGKATARVYWDDDADDDADDDFCQVYMECDLANGWTTGWNGVIDNAEELACYEFIDAGDIEAMI